MAAGRNDPCPCGSGKKYKKCCLLKDQEKWATSMPAPATLPSLFPSTQATPDLPRPAKATKAQKEPEMTPQEARWFEFEKADYPKRLELFQRTLDEGLMDDFNAVEMAEPLYHAA